MPAAAPEPGLPADGRASRSERSRRAICDACLDLVQEGELQPSADQIAERAGVSRRSIFNHFADLAELYDAVVEAGMARCAPLLEDAVPQDGSLEERVRHLVRVRCAFFEAALPFTRALTAQALVGNGSEQAVRVSREAVRRQHEEVARLLRPETGALSSGERDELLEVLTAALSALQWEFLRTTRGCSAARARSLVMRTVCAVLRDAGIALAPTLRP